MSETGDETVSAENATPVVKDVNAIQTERRSRFVSSWAALGYVMSLSRESEIKLRDSDRATTIMLAFVCALTIISFFIKSMVPQRLNLLLLCDVLFGATLFFYLTNRFGIVSTLPSRQALLTWQLMLCAFLIGTFVTVNLLMLLGFAMPNPPDLTGVH
jgi:hypothetical protein